MTGPAAPRTTIRDRALALGFDAVGFARPDTAPAADHLAAYVAAGYHGDMGWMAETEARRRSPADLWPDVRSIVSVAVNYGPDEDPLGMLAHRDRAAVSAYARGRDYHDVLKKRLRQLARWMSETWPCEVKLFVDTAPVMEKPVAQRAGLGWQGKHTNLVSREFGSWTFLGEVFTTLDLEADAPQDDHCGGCRRCLDACPTAAFPEPYRLDARRCISYLTIEHKGHIAPEFREAMGNRIFGCDDCLAVCPWNKFARASREARFAARAETDNPPLEELLTLDDASFRARFAGTPVKRTGRDRFVRNVLIAAGNSGDAALVSSVIQLLDDASPLVRAMAVWAASRLLDAGEFRRLRARHEAGESDADVRHEWRTGQS